MSLAEPVFDPEARLQQSTTPSNQESSKKFRDRPKLKFRFRFRWNEYRNRSIFTLGILTKKLQILNIILENLKNFRKIFSILYNFASMLLQSVISRSKVVKITKKIRKIELRTIDFYPFLGNVSVSVSIDFHRNRNLSRVSVRFR